MSRLEVKTPDRAQAVVEQMYRNMERRIAASPPGLCPVDMALNFLELCRAQTCGKCVPCRIGLTQLSDMMREMLDGEADLRMLRHLEETAQVVADTADCAIGIDAANLLLTSIRGFRDDFEEHILHHRCLSTLHNPVPCVAMCPAGVDIPGYISLVNAGRYADAVRLIRKDNPFPVACAYICEHPCEFRCRRNMVDDAINIRGLKRAAVDRAGEVPQPVPAPSTGKRVAIVGGGPSGLAAAYYLTLMGHHVTVYERRRQLGGMMRYGIPNYRFPREKLDGEIDSILSLGIAVHTDVNVGSDITLEQLRRQYDALFLSIGAHTDKKIGIEGEDAIGVMSAVDMLRHIGDAEMPNFTGMNVAVIGGGNVAMDVTRSAMRLGAKKVTCVYRRRQEDMTAQMEEVEGAIAEGAEVLTLHAPIRIEVRGWPRRRRCGRSPRSSARWIPPAVPAPTPPQWSRYGFRRISSSWPLARALSPAALSRLASRFSGAARCWQIPAPSCRRWRACSPAVTALQAPPPSSAPLPPARRPPPTSTNIWAITTKSKWTWRFPPPAARTSAPAAASIPRSGRPAERKVDFQCMECSMTDEEVAQESGRCLRCDHFGYGNFKGGRVEKW